jgi:hypothetical protein
MIDPLLETVSRIIRTGQNSNSYKFALLRTLAHIASRETSNPKTISRDRLAECFVAFYWDLTLKYRVRQGTNPDKDPRVMRLIRNLLDINLISEKTTLQEFQATDDFKRLVKQVAREAFDDVLPRLHTVRGAEQKPKLYEQEGEGVRIEDRTFEFLKSHTQVITQMAIGGWVQFTEQFTSAPKLFQKIQGVNPSRAALSFYRRFLGPYSNNECFYCDDQVGTRPHADHVIPWSYVLEDKAWNLVLSCDRCNRNKWFYLPPEKPFLDKLIQRNELMIQANLHAFTSGTRIKRDFAEWDVLRLEKHIRESWHKAQADGFKVWQPSPF